MYDYVLGQKKCVGALNKPNGRKVRKPNLLPIGAGIAVSPSEAEDPVSSLPSRLAPLPISPSPATTP